MDLVGWMKEGFGPGDKLVLTLRKDISSDTKNNEEGEMFDKETEKSGYK